jgi:hypothetical protein
MQPRGVASEERDCPPESQRLSVMCGGKAAFLFREVPQHKSSYFFGVLAGVALGFGAVTGGFAVCVSVLGVDRDLI